MKAFIVFLLIVAYAVATLAICYWVVLPLLPYVAVGGVGIGVLVGAGIVAATFAGLSALPRTIGPDQISSARARNSVFLRDAAWPQYLPVQAPVDLVQAMRNVRDTIGGVWSGLKAWLRPIEGVGWAWQVLALPWVFLVTASAGSLVGGAVAVLLCAAVLVPLALVWLAVAFGLRCWDRTVRRSRHALAGCPHPGCNNLTALPSYRCACGTIHRDIRPGVLGVVSRRCRCTRLLPTTVLRAGADLAGQCPACNRPLPAGAGTITDIRIPVIGPVSAGKTRLVYAATTALRATVLKAGGSLEPADETSHRVLEHGAALVSGCLDTAKTDADGPPAAISAVVALGSRRIILQLFDPPGELLAERDANRGLHFLDDAQGVVLVIDPFSVRTVRAAATEAGVLAAAHAASDEPESSYNVTAQRLRDAGLRLDRRLLAVAIVKADLLDTLAMAADLIAGDVDARTWLARTGLENLVLAAERDFREVGYFVVSSWTGWRPEDPWTALAPIAWLTGRRCFPVPMADAVVSS